MKKIIRISTVPVSLNILLKGQLKYLSNYYKIIAVSGEGIDLDEVKDREGVEIKMINMERNISVFRDIKALCNLYCYFKKEKPVVIHSMTPKAGLLSMVAGWMTGVPVRLHMFTGLIFPSKTGLFQKVLILMDRLLCACATTVYPEGEGVKRDLIRYRITHKSLKVIGNGNLNGIDTAYFSLTSLSVESMIKFRNTWNVGGDDFVFIFIGRLVKDKGINELVSAFKQINKQFPQTKLLLVGNEEPKHDPLGTDTIETIRNHPSIISAGFQNDVRPFLAIANVLVFPSYREGFPNVPMQAGAMGLPSIVTDVNGCNEIIIHEKNGLIVQPKNQFAIEEPMVRLLKDKKLYNTLAANAREFIVSRYDQQTLWNLIKEEYDDQLKLAGLL
jgi:glycosyltransferase involved in cell wall biosynthesis